MNKKFAKDISEMREQKENQIPPHACDVINISLSSYKFRRNS
jgi:hypothetical protein